MLLNFWVNFGDGGNLSHRGTHLRGLSFLNGRTSGVSTVLWAFGGGATKSGETVKTVKQLFIQIKKNSNMKTKIYKLLSIVKQRLFALALTVFWGTAYSQATYTFNYTGNTQTLSLQAGTYSVECWGGDGYTQTAGFNGKGGYASGVLALTSAQIIYINVGGLGNYPITSVTPNTWTFNGGGIGYPVNNNLYGNGGGASDVRTIGGTWDNPTSLASRAIVAGGGGAGRNTSYIGANGGGLTGGTGTFFSPDQTGGPTGGSQTAGGTNTGYTSGLTQATLGKAMTWDGNTLTASFLAGGGGGYYGGASGRVAGGGGSSYIGGVSSGTTIMFGQTGFVVNPDVTGNGWVIIKELCNISLTATGNFVHNAICSGGSATLTTNAISNYVWSTGATTSSIVVSPAVTTSYTLTATSPSNCTASAVVTVTVDLTPPPTLTVVNTASASGGVCPNTPAIFTASGATSYTWTGAQTVTNGVVFSPTVASGYTVTGGNGCGTSSAVTSISVHPFPTVNTVVSSNTVCSGNSMTMTATGNATNYAWSGGVTNGVGFIPTVTNTYVVIGTSALSCTASASVPITVHTTPNLPPTASPTLVCLGNSSTLSAVGAANYTWASTSQTVFTNTFVVTPTAMGITTYTITKANSTCSDVQTINLITNPLPSVFAFVTPTIMCSFNTATLSIGGAQSYVWTSPGPPSFTFSGASALVGPPVATTYSVAASDGTCVTTTTVFLDVSTNPTITTSPSSADVCVGKTVTITASGANSYTWASASGTLNSSVFTDTPASSTAYTVTGENAAGCKATVNQVIFVHSNPVMNVSSSNTVVCSGNPVTFTASGASSYIWDSNAGGVLTNTALANPTLNSSGFVTYSVQGTSSVNCTSTETVQVGVYIPTLTVSGNTAACEGKEINLLVSGGNPTSYQWTDGTNTSTGQNLSTTALAAVVYTISGTSNSLTLVCPAEQTIGISVSPNPTITAVPERTLFCRNDASINLIAGGGDSYSWSNASTGATVNVAPIVNTIYTVTGTDAGTGCSNTATIEIRINPCTGINELSGNTINLLVYPNPNNGEFTIETSSDMRLTLVNELGQLIRVIELEGANAHKVSIEGLAKGIYFINGQENGTSINQKIVVTK